ncbi:NAD-dependent epimerase/dehydratase family protein [Nocardioides flavescens]|uniref:NAD-dependent epimerase/dehydratase family protein n=1 Tax=Nocardioides flavescens TaxID=2691959 RepID=A0A6L7EZU6_9ACTN|nr:SDR family oxidoreductase [Nocardioides flavescens]MXG89939.1 NAD-dependent epimerase/dehydratase family protein [Nocardioides flavescens]
MRVLVTGVEGYLGAVLAPVLVEAGHEVVGLDTGYYLNGWLYRGVDRLPPTRLMDMREVTVADFEGVDAVVAMAELSNDPLGDLIGPVTTEVNHLGSVHVARTAKAAGVERFVYMSSCSVYGAADGVVDETSPIAPQTAYARCKALVERDLSALADDGFSPTSLRNATAFGASPRQRFDIVLNNLAGLAWTRDRIAMTSDGTPWRPLVHALDIAQAIVCTLGAERSRVHDVVLNVGSDDQNYTVRQIAETVAEVFPGCELTLGAPSGDNRSYRVDFSRIGEVLPDFSCVWDARRGAEQLRRVFESIDLDVATFEGRGHTRLKQIQHLLQTGQVDQRLFWVAP